jgi:catechol 2,3-dioxygenase-like lactoylglutathione lyase family enzyme
VPQTEDDRPVVGELNHVAIGVRDIETSLRFYVDGLGLRKTLDKPVSDLTWRLLRLPEGSTARSVFVQGPTRVGQVELVQWELPETDSRRPKRPGDIGLAQLSFPIAPNKINALHHRLVEMGYEVYTEPTTTIIKNFGPVTIFICEDPDGNQVEFIAMPSRETIREFRASHADSGGRA